jgi:hypothetical protein
MGQDHLSDFHGVRCRVKSHSSLGGRNEVRPVDLRGARIPRGAPQGAVRGHVRGVQDGSDKSQFLNGARLQPVETATVVRVRDRQTLTTDGPFADTNEVFGGFCVFDTDLDEAIELAALIPAVRIGGAIEVRPLVER